MKKKDWIQLLKKSTVIFVMVVFSVFSTGVMVSIRVCCNVYQHVFDKEHLYYALNKQIALNNEDNYYDCCTNETKNDTELSVIEEELLVDVCACQNHSHCFIDTYLIKITDSFVGSSILKDNIMSPASINLFSSILNNQLVITHKNNESQEVIFSPPMLKLVGANFINFTSQRVYYA